MRRRLTVLFVSFFVLAFAATALAQMMDQGPPGGGQMPMAQGMMPGQTPCGMMGQGMMGQGMMSQGMMGGMMGPGMTPCSMMMGMMPPKIRGCLEMTCWMMDSVADMASWHEALGLTDEQEDQLKTAHRPFQKEAVRIGASLKVAEMDVADLLSAQSLDMKKIESKFKEIEGIRTQLAMNHVNAFAAVRKILTKEQIDKLGNMSPCGGPCGQGAPCPPGAPCAGPAPAKAASPQGAPQAGPEHTQHH